MREILFRGRCTGEDDIYGWVDGFYVRLRDPYKKRESHRIYTGFAECDCGSFYGDCYEVDPKTVGQFTGLFDKNGERIFEGDIVTFPWYPNGYPNGSLIKMLIVFDEGEFRARPKETSDDVWEIRIAKSNEEFEVIGNIHDNPELMGWNV